MIYLLAGATIATLLLPILALAVMSITTQHAKPAGLENGQLLPCPKTPNCECSESYGETAGTVAPFSYLGTSEQALSDLKDAIIETGGSIQSDSEGYFAATFTSTIFRFVDDVEFRLVETESLIHVRSASRAGHSDLGANRKRVEAIREAFQALQAH